MNEIISGVQVIKMYTWEKPFAKLITYARRMELKSIRMTSYARAFQMILVQFTPRLVLFSTMISIVLINGPEYITSARIYAFSSILTVASLLMSQRFSRGIGELAEVLISLKRLEKFLNLEEKQLSNLDKPNEPNKTGSIKGTW